MKMVAEAVLYALTNPVILVIILIILLVSYVWYRFGVKPYDYFKKQNIDGPPPQAFMGSLGELQTKYKSVARALCQPVLIASTSDKKYRFGVLFEDRPLDSYADYLKKYGRTYGIFLGWKPFLVTVDPEMIKQIFVKNFDKFADRTTNASIINPTYKGKSYVGLTQASGEDWRRRRRILTPAFSSHKMRLMEPVIKESTLRLAAKVGEYATNGEDVDVQSLYNKYTMEVILSVGFGRTVDVQNGKGGEVYDAACTVFRGFDGGSDEKSLRILGIIAFIFPFLTPILRQLAQRSKVAKAMHFLSSVSEQLINIRREQGGDPNRKDLLQLMIDACDDDSKDSLSTGEIITDAMTFMLAGYETTSNFLTFASYLLAVHPNIQEKLFESITTYMEENQNKSLYDACNELDYLDMVANEVFRLYPPGHVIVRTCTEPCSVEGVRFDKGVMTFVPVFHLHRDEEFWPEPEKFDPERFLPSAVAKRHPCSHLPFGLGPRNCIGMRLAILEGKMALIEVLSKYKITTSEETKIPLEYKAAVTLSVKDKLILKFESRSFTMD